MEFRKDLIYLTFSSMDRLPKPFLFFLQELKRIQEGNINPVSFNKRKKDAQKLLDNWIEMAGGLMFERYLFEFQIEFDAFSQVLYRDILSLEKKFNQKKQKKIKTYVGQFLRKIKKNQVPADIFIICITHQKDIEDLINPKNTAPKKSWDSAKEILGITSEFEEIIAFDDFLEKEREKTQKLIDELYVMTPHGPVSRSMIKNQTIKVENFRYKK